MIRKFLLASSILVTALSLSHSAYSAVGTGRAEAVIQNPLAVQEAQNMNFATINVDPSGDLVTLNTNGRVSSRGASTFTGSAQAGIFEVYGTPNSILSVTFSSGNVLTGPGDDMPLDNFKTNRRFYSLDSRGNMTFKVGADLTVNSNQVGGQYSGTYSVTVNYQ